MKEKIEPEFPGGTTTYDRETMIDRTAMFATIKDIFNSYGFTPLQTPILQRKNVLTKGDEDMRVFSLEEEARTDSARALRFDLTVPFSVYLAQNIRNFKLPVKRSEIGQVFRPETPQKGRYNEFFQCDFDTAGTDSLVADAEVISCVASIMRALKVGEFIIRINSRKILNALPEVADYDSSKNPEVIRILDKLEKIGWEGVKKELQENENTNLNDQVCSKINEFLSIKDLPHDQIFENLEKIISTSKIGQEGVKELSLIVELIQEFDVLPTEFIIDLSIARGLGYYTGMVFETNLKELPSIGSVASGGRYDDLVESFGYSAPAVGGSIGLDRLYTALGELGRTSTKKSLTKIIVLPMNKSVISTAVTVTTLIRSIIPADIYMGSHDKLGDMISYADDLGIPFVAIIGDDEVDNFTVTIKNLSTREQTSIPIANLEEFCRKLV